MDELSGILEIEPLGTHRDYRRLGLARAVVIEVIRRAAKAGARDVLVWNEPANECSGLRLVHVGRHEATAHVVRAVRRSYNGPLLQIGRGLLGQRSVALGAAA